MKKAVIDMDVYSHLSSLSLDAGKGGLDPAPIVEGAAWLVIDLSDEVLAALRAERLDGETVNDVLRRRVGLEPNAAGVPSSSSTYGKWSMFTP